MTFYPYPCKKPLDGQLCIVKKRLPSGEVILIDRPLRYSVENGFFSIGHHSVVEWAPVPKHAEEARGSWKSERWGDNLPEKSCMCLICTAGSKKIKCSFYGAEAKKFYWHKDVTAFLVIEGMEASK